MTMQPDHQSRAHSSLSASSTERWWPCPRSVLLSEGFPNTSSEFAEQGTAAHELGNICLEEHKDAAEFLGKTIHGYEMDEDFAEAVQHYLDECRKYTGEGWEWWVERKFSLESLSPPVPMFGTSDFTAFHAASGHLVVVDYKHGIGVVKEAEGNPQLRYYGLGCWLSFPEGTSVSKVTMIIVQPRAPHFEGPKIAHMDPADLGEWAIELLARAELTQQEDAPMAAGDHCKFCLAAPCIEQARVALEAAQSDFGDWIEDAEKGDASLPVHPDLITPDQISVVLNSVDVLESFVKAVKAKAKTLLEHGIAVPGFSLENLRATTRWDKPDDADIEAFAAKVELGCDLPPGLLIERVPKLRSPAQAREELAEQLRLFGECRTKKESSSVAKSILSPYTTHRSSGTKVVPLAKSSDPAAIRGDEFAEFLEPSDEE